MYISRVFYKFFPLTILLITFLTINGMASFSIGNTFIDWALQIVILVAFIWLARYNFIKQETRRQLQPLFLVLLWFTFSIIRGVFLAEIYWDWKSLLTNSFVLLLPIVAYSASNTDDLYSILSFYIKYTLLPVLFIVLVLFSRKAIGYYFMPFCFFIFLVPALSKPFKIIVLLFAVIAIVSDFTTRSFMVKYGVPMLLIFFFQFLNKSYFSKYIIRTGRLVFLIGPFVLFTLGVLNIFNLFKINEYLESGVVFSSNSIDGSEVKEQSLTADTRTFLYVENLESAKKNNTWILGRSPSVGHESPWFAFMDPSGRGRRDKDEVAVLNIFGWTGIVGVVLYFLLFYKATFLAVYKSNNQISKLVGLYVSFRWTYSWIQDINNFDMSYFTLWLMIGFCISDSFRKMDDNEMQMWARGLFQKKYYLAYKKNSIS